MSHHVFMRFLHASASRSQTSCVCDSSRCCRGERAVRPAEGPGPRGDGELPPSSGGDPEGGGRSRYKQTHHPSPAQQVSSECGHQRATSLNENCQVLEIFFILDLLSLEIVRDHSTSNESLNLQYWACLCVEPSAISSTYGRLIKSAKANSFLIDFSQSQFYQERITGGESLAEAAHWITLFQSAGCTFPGHSLSCGLFCLQPSQVNSFLAFDLKSELRWKTLFDVSTMTDRRWWNVHLLKCCASSIKLGICRSHGPLSVSFWPPHWTCEFLDHSSQIHILPSSR